jgi:catalase-peroxidase
VEQAAKDAGETVTVPVSTGRGDATQDTTDIAQQSYLEPTVGRCRLTR